MVYITYYHDVKESNWTIFVLDLYGQKGFVGKPLLAVHSLNACYGQMHSALAVVKKVQSVSIWHKPRSILESNDDQSTNGIFH